MKFNFRIEVKQRGLDQYLLPKFTVPK